jgi:hypothetical protein
MQKEAVASCSARELNPCFSSDRTATCLEGLANPTPIASGHRGAVRENREPYQCARHICRDCSALWRPHFADHHMTSFGPLVQIFCNNARNEAAASIVRQTRLARKHSSKPRGSYRGDLSLRCRLPQKATTTHDVKSHCRICFYGWPAGSSCLALTLHACTSGVWTYCQTNDRPTNRCGADYRKNWTESPAFSKAGAGRPPITTAGDDLEGSHLV